MKASSSLTTIHLDKDLEDVALLKEIRSLIDSTKKDIEKYPMLTKLKQLLVNETWSEE